MYVKQNAKQDNLESCYYSDILASRNFIQIDEIARLKNFVMPISGGEHKPECDHLPSSSIIIPYRNRTEQLGIFVNYMHHFLQKQRLHYRIFIVDQNNTNLFNRAKLLNIGAKVAIDNGYPCLILHDIDLIPLHYGNIYACSKVPRHMSSSLDTFRYNLPYLTLFGGAVAILSEQYKEINGMSNLYEGWGGEDDDFYERLVKHNLTACRFCASVSKYTMLRHEKNLKKSGDRFNLLKKATERSNYDGLDSLNTEYTVQKKPLYTHIIVS
ncbi:hypothetical protein WA026_014599 [Henosepilachna vigintioctopunctata]|uniref:Beta-1,4-galactosyltransferase n=1 Tax=Henosepilachna vigintioctopunctata TaxID=420089 RepID=A0AAW1VGM2_9CUCU